MRLHIETEKGKVQKITMIIKLLATENEIRAMEIKWHAVFPWEDINIDSYATPWSQRNFERSNILSQE